MKARNKVFLSDNHEEFGSISWYVKPRGPEHSWGRRVQCELRLTDCSEAIVLDFQIEKQKHIAARLAKLDTLIHELQRCRDTLEQCAKEEFSVAKPY